jgi:hypothetical protein
MTITELINQIEACLIIKDINIEEEYLYHIASLAYESNYIQILYDYEEYGIDILLTILEILEKHEFYEQCAVIKQVIENTNELEGKSFPTKYSENE